MSKRIIDTIEDVPSYLISFYLKRLNNNRFSRLFAPLANVYRKIGLLDNAIEVCNQGIEFFPNYITGRMVRGLAFFEADRLEEAEEDFKIVEILSDKNLLAHRMLFSLYQKKDNKDACKKQLKKILAINPQDKEAIRKLNSFGDSFSTDSEKNDDKKSIPFIKAELIAEAKTDTSPKPLQEKTIKKRKETALAAILQANRLDDPLKTIVLDSDKRDEIIKTLEKWLGNICRKEKTIR